jgi:L,D-peptidoglycan transpeptidase YkuD (ErfK/YbiS/YcfS/YnhG family)
MTRVTQADPPCPRPRTGMKTMLARTTIALAVLALLLPVRAQSQTCTEPLGDARRLVMVTTASMTTFTATVQLFERTSTDAPWRSVQTLGPAVVGVSGLAWGHPFRKWAREGEPFKVEGDKRTPAGIYRIGRSFGFVPSSRPGYLHLKTGQTVCVDDPSSPAYNTITSRAEIGSRIHGEDMRRIRYYRRGLVVDYPTDAARRGGSCIFIHIWEASVRGTVGCIALPEARVETLQDFAQGGAVIAILPHGTLDRFAGCLPAASATLPP